MSVLFSLLVRSFFISWSFAPGSDKLFFVLFSRAQGVLQECVLPGRVQHGGVSQKPQPSRSMINLSMKDLYFWIISSTYSSIFARNKARFFTFKNLQATNELKATKYLGFYHIGGWFSPTFASHKFHVPLAEKMMLDDGVISSHPESFDQIILGVGFLHYSLWYMVSPLP